MSDKPSSSNPGKRKFDADSSNKHVKTEGGDDSHKKFKRSFSDKGNVKNVKLPGGPGKWKSKEEWKAGAPKAFSRKERQDMKRERKASKPNADLIAEANKIWQTSFTQMPAGERTEKIGSLLKQMSGKLQEVGLKHDASRAIQIAIKYATEEQKHIILKELTGQFRQLSEEKYGHYIVIKLMSNDTKRGDAKKLCLKEFHGHIVKLSTHPDSAKVLDFLYASSPRKDQNNILQEFYSNEFIVFGEEAGIKEKSLTEILQAKPEKKVQVLENLRKYLDKSVEKNMIMFRFFHALLLQYLTHASLGDDTTKEFLPNLYQFIPALHHSVDGCKIICHMLSIGTAAKERKNILKYFKGLVGNMAERPEGVWVLTCALDVVDDTVLLEKVIFAELLPNIKEQILQQYSAKIYLHVLNPHDAAIFSKDDQENYSISGKWILNQTDSAHRPQGPLSKKDPQIKRLELLNAFFLPLLQTLATLPDTLSAMLRSNHGHHLLVDTLKEAWRLQHDEEAQQAASAPAAPAANKKNNKKKVKEEDGEDGDNKEDEEGAAPAAGSRFPSAFAKKLPQLTTQLNYVFESLVKECGVQLNPEDAGDARGSKSNPLEDRFGHYVIKHIISFTPQPNDFLEKLVDQCANQWEVLATTNRPAFVLSSILEKDLAPHAARVKKELKPLLKQITAAASTKPVPVAAAPAVKDESKKGNKNAPVYNAHSTTNAGVDLLSRLLQGLPTGKGAATTAAAPKPSPKASPKASPKTPAKSGPAAPAAKSAKKGAAAEAVVKMEDDEEPVAAAASAKTPAKSAKTPAKKATTAKKGKKNTDDMEE